MVAESVHSARAARQTYGALRRSGLTPGHARSLVYDLLAGPSEFGRLLPADTDPRRLRSSDRLAVAS